MPAEQRLGINEEQLASFCREHHIERMWIFGSILREDFGPDSDVDLLVDFDPAAQLSFWDVVRIQGELADLLGRPVDLVETEGLANPFRRREILRTRRLLYAA